MFVFLCIQVPLVRKGDECLVTIDCQDMDMAFGRQFNEDHILYSAVTPASMGVLADFFDDELTDPDRELLSRFRNVFPELRVGSD